MTDNLHFNSLGFQTSMLNSLFSSVIFCNITTVFLKLASSSSNLLLKLVRHNLTGGNTFEKVMASTSLEADQGSGVETSVLGSRTILQVACLPKLALNPLLAVGLQEIQRVQSSF